MPKAKSPASEVVLKLRTPVEMGSERITEITFQRPKGKHLKKIGTEVNGETVMTIASKISGHPPMLFDELDVFDWRKVGEVIGDFLDDGQKDGDSIK